MTDMDTPPIITLFDENPDPGMTPWERVNAMEAARQRLRDDTQRALTACQEWEWLAIGAMMRASVGKPPLIGCDGPDRYRLAHERAHNALQRLAETMDDQRGPLEWILSPVCAQAATFPELVRLVPELEREKPAPFTEADRNWMAKETPDALFQ